MFFTYLRRELRRRRKAALFIASGLALGIALVITVNSVSAGMQQAQGKVLESLYGLGTDMTVTKAAAAPGSNADNGGRPSFNFDAQDSDDDSEQSADQVRVQGFQTLATSTVTKVGKQSGVADAVGGLSLTVVKLQGNVQRGQFQQDESTGSTGNQQGGAPGGNGGNTQPQGEVQGGGAQFDVNNYTLFGVDVTNLDLGPLTSSEITKGKTFTASQTNAKVAVVDSAYAKENELAVGGSVTVSGTKFAIIGVATASSGDAAASVYIPLQQAQTLSDSKDKVTTIYVTASDSKKIDAVKTTIQKNITGTTVTTSADLAASVSGSLSTASKLATNVGKWLSIAVLIAAFLVAGLLTSSAVSRRVREFGTLKALGWTSGRVTRQVMGEALVNGLLGGVLGIALGLAAAYSITAFGPVLEASVGSTTTTGGGGGPGGGFGRQSAAKALELSLSAPVSVDTIAIAVGLAIAGGLVAGTFGGWRASRLRPADALRSVA